MTFGGSDSRNLPATQQGAYVLLPVRGRAQRRSVCYTSALMEELSHLMWTHSGSSESIQMEILDLDLDQSELTYLSSLTGLIPTG